MKLKPAALNNQYLRALRTHLRGGSATAPQAATRLGRQAVRLKMETLALARIHENALSTLKLSNPANAMVIRAQAFFTAALSPVVESSPTSRRSRARIDRLESALNERTLQLASTNRLLKKRAIKQKAAEAALKGTGLRYAKLLEESLSLQNGLRELSHQLMRAQERDRKRFSKKLQTEIVQALVAVDVGLINLGKDARKAAASVLNEVGDLQVFAGHSAKVVGDSAQRFSRE